MADNTELNAGSGGDTISTDDIAGVKVQRVKVQYGVDGAATDVSDTNPLPIDDAGGSITVDGTVTANLSATDNAVLDAIAAAQLPDGHNVTVDNASLTVDLGANNDVTVTGTVDLGATDNAVLDSIDSAVNGTLSVDLGANNDVTVTGTVDLGATDNGVLDSIASNTTGLAGCVSGSELQVDIVSGGTGSTQYAEDSVHSSGDTGTMVLGVRNDTLAALAGADGDYAPLQVNADGALYVEVQDLGGTSNVDTAAGGTDSGAVTLAVRDDSLTTLTPADGDYTPLRVNSTGALHVTGAGGGTQYNIDDAVGGTDTVTMAGVVRDDSLSTLTEADGDVSVLRVSSTGALHVTGGGGGTEYTEDAAAPTNPTGTASLMERDDALGGLTPVEGDWSHQFCNANGAMWTAIDGTVTVDLGANNDVTVTGTVDLGATDNAVLDSIDSAVNGTLSVDLGANNDVTVTSGTITANLGATDNAVLDSIDSAVNGTLTVGSHAVTNAGTFATQASQAGTWNVTNISGTVSLPTGASTAANQATQTTALQLIDNPIVAHDAAVSGSSGVNMAGFNARSAEPTAVASADATQGLATLLGKQVVVKGAIPASTWRYAGVASGVTDTSDDVAKAAAGAGIRNYITGVQVMNGHATVSTEVVIKDGSTVIWRGFAQAAGGGCSATFDPPLRGTANTAVNVANITTGSATRFNLQGYVAAE